MRRAALDIVVFTLSVSVAPMALAEGPAQPTLDQAMALTPEALARDYLLVRFDLDGVMTVLNEDDSVNIFLDGADVEIDASNASAWRAGLEARLRTYGTAIRERGFKQVAGRFAIKEGVDCEGGVSGETCPLVEIAQTGFDLELRHEPPEPDGETAHGVIVESILAFGPTLSFSEEAYEGPPLDHVVGRVAKRRRIDLRATYADGSDDCRIVLVRR